MPDKTSLDKTSPDKTPKVYVIQGRGQRDYADCQTALDRVPARMESVPFIGDAAEVIERTRDADALIISSSPVTRRVMESLEGLKVVVRTGVGYDVIDVPAATELGVVVVNVPDVWIREVANHALALLLAWNRKIVVLDREIRAGVWSGRVPGAVTGSLHGETVGVVGLGNIGSAFARRVAALETHVIACDPYVDDARFKALGGRARRSFEDRCPTRRTGCAARSRKRGLAKDRAGRDGGTRPRRRQDRRAHKNDCSFAGRAGLRGLCRAG